MWENCWVRKVIINVSAVAWNWFRWRHSAGSGFVPYRRLRQPYQHHQQAKWKTSAAAYGFAGNVTNSASSIIRYRLWRIWAAPAKRFFPITSSANSWRGAPDCLLSDIPFPNNPRNCLPFTRRVGSKRKEVCENHQRNSKRMLLPMCSRLFSPRIKSFLLMHEAIPAETLKLSFVSHRMEKLVSWKR